MRRQAEERMGREGEESEETSRGEDGKRRRGE